MEHLSVLIVDDEERFANTLAKRLILRGCACEVCYSGQEALNMIKRKDFLLILLDLHLPDIYGIEVLAQIKSTGSRTPIVILTGHGTERDRQECIQLGAHDFIHKPLEIDAMMALLDKFREGSA